MERQYMWGNDSVSLAFEVNADEHVSLSRIVFGMVEKVFCTKAAACGNHPLRYGTLDRM